MKFGFMLPIAENGEGEIASYPQLRSWVQQAESLGIDTIWLPDHLIFRFPEQPMRGVHEVFTIWAALLEATERITIGTMVLCVPFRNPGVVAKMAVTLDEISNGRIILGLGAGWHQPEFDAFGFPFDKKVDKFEEALEIIVPALREGVVDFTGTHYNAVDMALSPAPTRNIPILIASKGPRMLSLTAKWADQWNGAWFGEFAGFKQRHDEMLAALDAEGRDRSSFAVTAGVTIKLPESPDAGEIEADRSKWLSGSVEEIAADLIEYADAGVEEVVIGASPINDYTIGLLAQIRSLVNERTA